MAAANRTGFIVVIAATALAVEAFAQRSTLRVPEVRQLVTIRFADRVPLGSRPSLETMLELYRATPAVLRLRGFTEAESPDPFDLILMTSYRGLDGFDTARRQLSQQRTRSGATVGSAYRRLDEMSESHRDHFIEMVEDLDYQSSTPPELYVFEWVRLTPAAHRAYELLLQTAVFPWERDVNVLHHSETGRVIIGDEWDYVRILGFSSFGAYHEYVRLWREHGASDQVALHVTARKTFVVREDDSLRIR